jgi:hypothetical protein
MNARLKDSIEAAERSLPSEGQEQLAALIDLFTVNFERSADADFSADELRHLRAMADEPFVEADPKAIAALFRKHGA